MNKELKAGTKFEIDGVDLKALYQALYDLQWAENIEHQPLFHEAVKQAKIDAHEALDRIYHIFKYKIK